MFYFYAVNVFRAYVFYRVYKGFNNSLVGKVFYLTMDYVYPT